MKIMQKIFAIVIAMSALMPLSLLPIQAHAQQFQATPHIEGFNVDEVSRLDTGAELNFDI